jgi:GNAT superfamily N-acetyltransferase
MSHRFDAGYREQVMLADGSGVLLRPVRPDDKPMLVRGFERLSQESRYRRFLGAKSRLTSAELAYLTELDGINHFAIAATHKAPSGEEEGLGIARFVRQANRPAVAEAAVTVIDEWQHKGLGTILLERLARAARERGITHFTAVALRANPPVRALLAELAPVVSVQPDGEELKIVVALDELERAEQAAAHGERPTKRVLAAAAKATSLLG